MSESNHKDNSANLPDNDINKRRIILVSYIAGFLVLSSITAVLIVVLHTNNNKEPIVIDSPPPTEETVHTPTPGNEQEPDPTPDPTSESQPLSITPIQYFEMSDDILDFTLMYDGDVLQLPMTLEVFMSYGWETDTDLSGTLVSGHSRWCTFSRGDKKQTVYLANISGEPRYISKATVYGLVMPEYQDYMKNYYIEIELPRGVKTGSTVDEVIAAFGEPAFFRETETDDGDIITTLKYYSDRFDVNSFYRNVEIKARNGVLVEITVQNKTKLPSDSISDAAEVNTEITERERNYRAPDELGNTLSSYNIEIDGDLYSLPAPLSVFLNNGWEIPEGKPIMLSEGNDIVNYELQKGNFRLSSIILFNYSDSLMYIENCFVVGVTSLQYGTQEAVFTLPGNITVGTPEDTLLDMFGDVLEKKYYYDFESWYYHYTVTDYMQFVKISIDKDTKLVSIIEVRNHE